TSTMPAPVAIHWRLFDSPSSQQRLTLFFFSSRRRHTRSLRDWSSDVCSSDLRTPARQDAAQRAGVLEERRDQHEQARERHERLRSEERRVGKEWRTRRWSWA